MEEAERWLSVDEISIHLGIAPITVYRWVEKQRIPFHRIGRQLRFLVSEVNSWVKSGEAAVDLEGNALSEPGCLKDDRTAPSK